jgi:formamidopyrimidine-DNA glycosylase
LPELPEVEIVRRGLERVTQGLCVRGAEVLLPRAVAWPAAPVTFIKGITGCMLTGWRRRGKYLFADLTNPVGAPGGCLAVHLRMTGQLLWLRREVPVSGHCRVRFFFDEDRELRFTDQRTFGRVWWVSALEDVAQVVSGVRDLGPEPLSDEFSVAYLHQRLAASRRPVKTALLDQRWVAGIGNIYADEALFLAGIRPETPCDRIGRVRARRLRDAVRAVLTASIEAGGTTFSDYRDVYGGSGRYSEVAWVYGRGEAPCRRCRAPVRRIKLGGRSAHYCARCQR